MSCAAQRVLNDVWAAPESPYVGVDAQSSVLVGAGDDLLIVIRSAQQAMTDYLTPASRQPATVEERFATLAAEWRAATATSSSIEDMCLHPAYQQIIGLGCEAVPLLLRELARRPDHWFWALRAISGVDPVPAADRGRVRKMAQTWLNWGREEGYC